MIANSRLGVSMEEDGEMYCSLTRPHGEHKVNQGILSLNPKQTYELLKKSGMAEQLAPGWNTKYSFCLTNNPNSKQTYNLFT